MVNANNNKTRAEELIDRMDSNQGIRSRSEGLIQKKASMVVPEVSSRMARGVSAERREIMEMQVESGELREQGSGSGYSSRRGREESQIKMVQTQAGVVSHSGNGLQKFATTPTGNVTSSSGWRGSNSTTRQVPEVYSPLWLNSNLNLPRDRPTINAWARSFFALNPIVHNAITLHSTYPIAKLNIKCKDPKVEKFFSQMNEEIDLMSVAVMAAQEYWILGEAFIYGELDEHAGKWGRLMILNPDYVNVQRSVIAAEPIISLRPDENLRRVVHGNQPSDIQQRKQLDPSIVEHVRRNQNIPLNNFYVHHMARRISPYEIRGTGLVVSCFRALMLWDKLRESKYAQADNMVNPLTLVKIGNEDFRPTPVDLEHWKNVFECHDEETEVLTDQGFKKFDEVIEYREVMDGTTGHSYVVSVPFSGVKIACFNPNNEQLEYHEPLESHVYNYDGDMYHFHNDKIDIKVTPNHDMWTSEKEYEYHGHRSKRKTKWGEWKKIKAECIKTTDWKRFRSCAKWLGETVKNVNVCGKDVPIELYLEFLGYLLSEGCLYTNNKSQYTVGIAQTYSKFQKEMSICIDKFAAIFGKNVINSVHKRANFEDIWTGTVSGKQIYNYFQKEVGDENGNVKSFNKHIPRWILDLNSDLLKILLDALVSGDGSVYENPKKQSNRFSYYSTSKQLANDVYEIAYKCGYVPVMFVRDDENYLYRYGSVDTPRRNLYTVCWSTSGRGEYPLVYKYSKDPRTKEKKDIVNKVQYKGKVWCFTVPTGLFITRRNGKITIQGNSAQYDKDFKIFSHNAVDVVRVGYGQGIFDTSNDVTQLIKEIYIGLMVPSVIMDGSDTTYATGSVALDVLRQRYMQFRQMMTTWLKRKIFAPISQIQEFYEYENGEKTLIIPDVDWNHMSLFDMDSYINNMVNLSQGEGTQKRVSLQTMYRSLGLEYEEEQRKIRFEDIQDAIRIKEIAYLQKYSVHELRSLGPGDEIEEPTDTPVPGENPYEEVPGETGAGGGGAPGGLAPPGSLFTGGPKPGGAPPPAPIGAGGLKLPGGGKPPTGGTPGNIPPP